GFGAIDYDNLTALYIPQSRFEKKTSFFNKLGITTSEFSGFKFKEFIDANKIIKEVNTLIDIVTKNRNHEYQTELYKGEIVTTYIDKGIRD
ncbi:hypothetical protein GN156_28540, partial [bacterium LRH843]|nr:hypothetical protein [bacterium LRH843]